MRQTLRSELRALAVVALLLLPTTSLHAQQPSTTNATIEAQLRQAIHEYDDGCVEPTWLPSSASSRRNTSSSTRVVST